MSSKMSFIFYFVCLFLRPSTNYQTDGHSVTKPNINQLTTNRRPSPPQHTHTHTHTQICETLLSQLKLCGPWNLSLLSKPRPAELLTLILTVRCWQLQRTKESNKNSSCSTRLLLRNRNIDSAMKNGISYVLCAIQSKGSISTVRLFIPYFSGMKIKNKCSPSQ